MEKISMHDLKEKIESLDPKKDLVLDVRSPAEFADGHVKGAVNIPLDQLPSRLGELKDRETVYVHCQKGGRAQMAADFLAASGVNIVCIGDSGMADWIEAGFPVEKGA